MKNNRSLIQWIRKISISTRISLLILLVCILPILIMGIFGCVRATSTIDAVVSKYNMKLTETLRENLTLQFSPYLSFLEELSQDPAVLSVLADGGNAPQEKNSRWHDIVSSRLSLLSDLDQFTVLSKEGETLYQEGTLPEADFQADATRLLTKASHRPVAASVSQAEGQSYFVLAAEVVESADNGPVGALLLYLNPSILNEAYRQYQIDDQSNVLLMDYSKASIPVTPVHASEAEQAGYAMLQTLQEHPQSDQIFQYSVYNSDSHYYVYYTRLEPLGLILVTSITHSYFSEAIQSMVTGTLLLTAGCLVLCLLISKYLKRSITLPLQKMVASIDQASHMRFESVVVDDGDDELGFLSMAYQKIVERLKEMVSQIETEQEGKRSAELKMLQAQINPHFLFNTLDSLRFTALMSNDATVSQGLSSLSHILRNSIVDSNPFIPLSEELNHIQDYLTIMNIRFGESIHLTTNLAAGTEDSAIMKFLLQPIVENSVIHGRRDNTPLEITVTARCSGGMIFLEIRDNGKGFDPENQKDSDTGVLKSSKFSGIGLENIRQRLSLEYKAQQSMCITSTIGEGTTVTLCFPQKKAARSNGICHIDREGNIHSDV